MLRPALTLPVLLLALAAPPAAEGQSRFQSSVSIGQVDSVWSATLEEHRPYLVYTPPSYGDTTVAPQHYPVLYLLDGDAHFHSVSGLVQILGTGVNGTFVIPEMIVVAIPNTDRNRDLSPTHAETGPDGKPQPAFATSGGGPRFLSFVKDELIPHVDARYRTRPYRVFVGHSLGGITTLSALYTMPETFDAYVSIDPSLWWDGRTLLTQARDHFSSARLEGKTLYVAQANTLAPDTSANVHYQSIAQFNEVMKAYDRSGIRFAFRYYGDDSHGSVPLIAEYDALRFIFDGYGVPLQRVMERPASLTEHFREVSARLGSTFSPSEGMLRLLGNAMMAQDTVKAIEFGEMRASLYPGSWRAQAFLGDAWAARGDQQKARGYYEAALAKGGDRVRLQERLDRLGR